jgi:hypothetical protein
MSTLARISNYTGSGGSSQVTRLDDLKKQASNALIRQSGDDDGDGPSFLTRLGAFALGNPVSRAVLAPLELAAVPQRAVASTLKELSDLVGITDDDVSFSDWKSQVADPTYGIGTLLAGEDGKITGNKWLDRAIGLAGDIATDPLTYLTLGTGAAAGRTGRLATAARLAAREAPEELVQRAGQRGLNAITSAERAAFDLPQAGIRFAGRRIGGTERAAEAIGSTLSAGRARLADTRAGTAARRARTDERLVEAVEKLVTGRGPQTAVEAAQTIGSFRGGTAAGTRITNEIGREANEIAGEIDDETRRLGVVALEEGNVNTPALGRVRMWFDSLVGPNNTGRLNEEFGTNIPYRQNYVPHIWTEKGRDLVDSGDSIGADLRRILGITTPNIRGSQIAEGRVLVGGKHNIGGRQVDFGRGTIGEINLEMRRVFGDVIGDTDVLESDLVRIMDRYVGFAGQAVEEATFLRGLVERGVADETANRLVQQLAARDTLSGFKAADQGLISKLNPLVRSQSQVMSKIDKKIDVAIRKYMRTNAARLRDLGEAATGEAERAGVRINNLAERLRDPARREQALRSLDRAVTEVDDQITLIERELVEATQEARRGRRNTRSRLLNRKKRLEQERAGLSSLLGDLRLVEREMNDLIKYRFGEVDANEFHAAINRAMGETKPAPAGGMPVEATLSVYTVDEYANMQTFLSPDGKSGYAIKYDPTDGEYDLVSVFNVGQRGMGAEAVIDAVWNRGATKLDAFDMDGFLPNLYDNLGFEEYDRLTWDPQYAPDNWKDEWGTPDVVLMRIREDVRDATDTRLRSGEGDPYASGVPRRSRKDQGVPDGVPERLASGPVDAGLRTQRVPASQRRTLESLQDVAATPRPQRPTFYQTGQPAEAIARDIARRSRPDLGGRTRRITELEGQRQDLLQQLEEAGLAARREGPTPSGDPLPIEVLPTLPKDVRVDAGRVFVNGVELQDVEAELARQSGRIVDSRMNEAYRNLNHWSDVRDNLDRIRTVARRYADEEKALPKARKTAQNWRERQVFVEGVIALTDPERATDRIGLQQIRFGYGENSSEALAAAVRSGLGTPEGDLTYGILADYYRLESELLDLTQQADAVRLDRVRLEAGKRALKAGDWDTANQILEMVTDGQFHVVYRNMIEEGWKEISERLGVAVPDRMVAMLESLPKSQREMNKLWRVWDRYIQFFKTYATLSPRFHARNFMSAVFMNAAHGVSADSMQKGLNLWRRYMDDPRVYKSLTSQEQQVIDAVLASGAGQFDELGRAAVGSALTQNRVTNASYKAGQMVEGVVRAGMAWDSIVRQGGIFEEAVARIEFVHFIYSDTSRLDQAARRLIPFWTFFSRNIPMQIQTMWTRPKAYQMYNQVMKNVSADEEGDIVPFYLKDQGAVKLPFGDNLYFAPDIGFNRLKEDLSKLTPEGLPRLASDTIAPLRLLVEGLAGERLYTGQPFDDDRAVPVSGPKGALLPLMALLGGVTEDERGRLAYTDFANYATESLVPPLGQLERLFPQEERNQQRRLTNVLGFLTGAPVRQVTPRDIQSELYRRGLAQRS